MVRFYALMCLLGTVLPYGALVASGVENGGLDVAAMLAEIAGSRMSLFAWADVLVSAVVLIAFIRHEGQRASVPGLWVPIALGVNYRYSTRPSAARLVSAPKVSRTASISLAYRRTN